MCATSVYHITLLNNRRKIVPSIIREGIKGAATFQLQSTKFFQRKIGQLLEFFLFSHKELHYLL